MGAGKTTVAGLLAERWGVAVRDTDHDVEAAAGKQISEIFVDDGEDRFRALERAAVAEALADPRGRARPGRRMPCSTRAPATGLRGHRVVFLEVGSHRRGEAGRASASAGRCCSATCGPASRRCSTSGCRSTRRSPPSPSTPTAAPPRTSPTRWPGSWSRPRSRGRRLRRRRASRGPDMHDVPGRPCCTSAGASPYDVRRRHRAARRAAADARRGGAPGRGDPPPGAGRHRRGDPGRPGRPGLRRARDRDPRRRGGQARAGGVVLLAGARPDRLHPQRRRRHRRRRRDHRHGRLRRRHLAARRQGRAPADDAARDGRRGGRRQDRDEHDRGQEPRRRLPRAGRGALRPRHPGVAAPQRADQRSGRGGQVRLHRRPGDPRPGRGRPDRRRRARLRVAARADRAGDPGQGRRRRRRPQGDRRRRRPPRPGGAQLRPHARPRDRAGRALHLPARRGGRDRHDVRRRAGPARRPARRGHRRPAPLGAGAGRPAHDVPRRRLGHRCTRR